MIQSIRRLGLLLGFTPLLWAGMMERAIAHPHHELLDLLNAPEFTPSMMLTGLGIAFILGAGHALSPGHGKTMVAAYLVGSQSTPWHAVWLGLITTITHTAAVFALGLVALLASQYVVPEQLYPSMSFVSGLMVCAVGVSLLSSRLQGLTHATPHHHDHDHHDHNHHDDAHHHDHSHALDHAHDHNHPHDSSVKSLLTLGIAGGLVPCPSALVLLLSAIAIHQTAYGMVLISTFSLGLTLVLISVGVSVIYARQWFDRFPNLGSLSRQVSVVSAIAIIIVGAVLTTYAVIG